MGVTMKRMVTLAVSAAFLLCTVGCSGNSTSSSNPPTTSSEQPAETIATPSQNDYEEEDYTETDDYSEVDDYSETTNTTSTGDGVNSVEYYEVNDQERKSILADPNDYESSSGSSPYFTSVKLHDIVYYGLGNYFGDIHKYSGNESLPGYIGFGDHGMNGTYYTYFGNHDNNCYLMFSTSHDTYFNTDDYCYGARGWFSRVFDYEKTQGLCRVRDLADYLNASTTYPVSSWPEEYYVPSNLDSDGLYAIEADLDTTLGVRSCVILLEASSESGHISSDTWVEVLVLQ